MATQSVAHITLVLHWDFDGDDTQARTEMDVKHKNSFLYPLKTHSAPHSA